MHPVTPTSGLSARLRHALDHQKIPAARLAGHIGVHRQTVGRWLQGHPMSVEHFAAVCQAMQLDPTWLLYGRHAAPHQQTIGAIQRTANALQALISDLLRALGLSNPRDR